MFPLTRSLKSFPAWQAAGGWEFSLLGEIEDGLSMRFARSGHDKWSDVEPILGSRGVLLIPQCIGRLPKATGSPLPPLKREPPTEGRARRPETEGTMIVVDQVDALVDQPIAIALRGFARRQPVSVTATQTYAEAERWQSRATFISDNVGQVDVTRQAPASGPFAASAL